MSTPCFSGPNSDPPLLLKNPGYAPDVRYTNAREDGSYFVHD